MHSLSVMLCPAIPYLVILWTSCNMRASGPIYKDMFSIELMSSKALCLSVSWFCSPRSSEDFFHNIQHIFLI